MTTPEPVAAESEPVAAESEPAADGPERVDAGRPEPAVVVPSARRRVRWHTVVSLAVAVGALWVAWRHWPTLERGVLRLAVADPDWLLLGAVATAATWLCSALAQQGAVRPTLPARRLVATQFAASAANHVLPAGLGAGAVNLRFLMRCGLPASRSATALAVKATAGGVARGALIAALAPGCPGLLRIPHLPRPVLAVALAVTALLAAVPFTPLWAHCRRALAAVAADIRAVHARPQRAAALWGGSLAFAALHALVLVAVGHAVELPLPAQRVALLYLAASTAAALLPTPGGLGSLDAALVLALTLAGAPAASAASTVIGYRLLTVWLPLIPGLVTLGWLVRRKTL
ncbi:lysylphosphatidylglycerol synthase transmembrane domain-containing protein [Streptomyces sp. NPDC048290]|uniref:lysylphosphatidylglycerol synthase transmembrane domain-containing protein n=1 Tax=Streptomyces sp. NPDC048290 TaxID=3155811 RepID=UPI003447B6E4